MRYIKFLTITKKQLINYFSVIFFSSISTLFNYLNLYSLKNVVIFFSKYIIFLLNVSLLILALLFLIKTIKKKNYLLSLFFKYLVYAGLIIHSTLCILDLLVLINFQHQINPETVFIFIETNIREASEFIFSYFNINILKFLVILIVPIFFIKLVLSFKTVSLILEHIAIIFLIFTFIISLASFIQPSHHLFYHVKTNLTKIPTYLVIKSLFEYKKEMNEYRSVIAKRYKNGLKGSVINKNRTEKNLFIFIIGESANRNHMSLYGYKRETNPLLNKTKNQLYTFKDVISPHSHTIPSLKKILTMANYSNENDNWYNFNILNQYFQNSEFKTYWISNQEVYTAWGGSTVLLPIALTFDVTYFNQTGNSNNSGDLLKLDEDLIFFLESVIQDEEKNKFIVLHLMGNHVKYQNRYPEKFNVFKNYELSSDGRGFLTDNKKQIINQYDNSILYNDYIIYQAIKLLKDQKINSYLLYISDHGEEVYDNRDFYGHTESIGNRHMVEIPFILWTSKEYQLNNYNKILTINKNLELPYMTDDVIHTILDLSNLKHSTFDSTRSIINKDYNQKRKRYYNGHDYDKELKLNNANVFIQRNSQKVWAHRVNSIEKLKIVKDKYFGVELDIVFVKNDSKYFFDVNHPPAKSISLKLDDYLSSINISQNLHYWLDLKNLNSQNQKNILKRLLFLINKYNLKDKLIIESSNYKSLSYISNNNIKTSYYLPVIETYKLSNNDKHKFKIKLIEQIKKSKVNTISYPGDMHNFVKEYICPEFKTIELMTWLPLLDINKPKDAIIIQEIINDNLIKVVLTKHKTKFDR